MKKIFEVGDRLKVNYTFGSCDYVDAIRRLAGTYVTVREVTSDGNSCWIEETKGFECDELWEFDDFIL